MLVFRKRDFATSLGRACNSFRRLATDCFRATRRGLASQGRFVLAILLFIFIAAVWTRLLELNRPPFHDEAKTWVWFVIPSWVQALSDYCIPGNHILQSALSRLCYVVFGDHLWAYRLPVFVAGVLVLPFSYALALALFGRQTALLSTPLIAFSLPLISYSVNARGYALVALAFLVLLGLAHYIRGQPRSLIAWALFVFVAGLSMWTIPVAAIYVGIAGFWTLLRSRGAHGAMFLRLLLAATGTLLFTILLYSPVILRMGFSPIVANPYVRPLGLAAFLAEVRGYFVALPQYLLSGMPNWARWVGAAFFAFGLCHAWHRRALKQLSLALAVFGFFLLFLAVRRVLPPHRVAVPLIPLVYMFMAYGFVCLLCALGLGRNPDGSLSQGKTELLVSGLAAVMSLLMASELVLPGPPRALRGGQCKSVAAMLRDIASCVTERDRVITKTPMYGPVLYYAQKYGLEKDALYWIGHEENNSSLLSSERLYIITNERLAPLSVLVGRQKELGTLFSDPTVWREYADGTVYRLHRRHVNATNGNGTTAGGASGSQ